jgi:hypothetical protein
MRHDNSHARRVQYCLFQDPASSGVNYDIDIEPLYRVPDARIVYPVYGEKKASRISNIAR